MIVFDLRCATGHVFEAWFGSSRDYEDQRARGLVACPVCGSATTEKAAMAPNIAAKGNQSADVNPAAMKAAMRELARMQAAALKESTWVGRDFANQARAMHVGEQEQATIHGQATPAEARALAEEGVPVAPLPLPVVPPDQAN